VSLCYSEKPQSEKRAGRPQKTSEAKQQSITLAELMLRRPD
jgi:hypothetical protein